MRNHDEKALDIARSVLPSTRRRGARADRVTIHARERARARARARAHLRELARLEDPDEFERDLTWEARREIGWMVEDRRAADKVGPLMRWAERKVETDPELADASFEERLAHFRRLLPEGLIGRHALFHLEWVLDEERTTWRRAYYHRRHDDPGRELRDKVAAIVAVGRHGELNRRIRLAAQPYYVRHVTLPAERLIDDDNPPPGRLLPRRTAAVHERIEARFLRGAHDIDGFAKQTGAAGVVHELHAELVRDGLI